MLVIPGAIPVIKPDEGATDAIVVSALVHTPPTTESFRLPIAPKQIFAGPEMGDGRGLI